MIYGDEANQFNDGMTRYEIKRFFDQQECRVREINLHDLWDNFSYWVAKKKEMWLENKNYGSFVISFTFNGI